MALVIRKNFERRPDSEPVVFDEKEGLTDRSAAGECDINRIMSKYMRTGTVPQGVSVGQYGDFSLAGDYLAAQQVIVNAREQFEALPSAVRDRFRNSPEVFLEFIHNKANTEEAQKLGLLKEVVAPPPPVSVKVVTDAPPGGSAVPVVSPVVPPVSK